MEFVNGNGKVVIDHNCVTYFNKNNQLIKKELVIYIGVFTEERISISTKENRYKSSKGDLYVYRGNEVIDQYQFSGLVKNETIQKVSEDLVTGVDTDVDTDLLEAFGIKTVNTDNLLLMNQFILKKDYIIKLYKDNTPEPFTNYTIECNDTIEEVVEKIGNGFDIIYKTGNGNELLVSKNRNSKWNGIPIGNI